MKVNRLLVIFLVMIGVGVGFVSLYTASISGVMGKMGLVGGDFSQTIKKNELVKLLVQADDVDCNLLSVGARVPNYLISRGEEKIVTSGEFGKIRILCGIRHVQRGNVERGVYTIIKGLYYLKTHYVEMREVVQKDVKKCEILTDIEYGRWVEGYLNATEGRIHEIVLELYKQVEGERARVEELCTD